VALVAVDEDVVALEVAVDDRRVARVQVGEAPQQLPRPRPDGAQVHAGVPEAVGAERAGGEELGDEVEAAPGHVHPRRVEADDAVVPELAQQLHLRVHALHGVRGAEHVGEARLVPRHLHAALLVEAPVHRLHGAFAQELVEPSIATGGVSLDVSVGVVSRRRPIQPTPDAAAPPCRRHGGRRSARDDGALFPSLN